MNKIKNAVAYLEIVASFDNISKKYREVLDDYIEGEPVIMYLPWPIDIVPPIDRSINCPTLHPSFEELKVVDYYYSLRDTEVRVYICVEQSTSCEDVSCDFSDEILLQFAKLGFCISLDEKKTIEEILTEKGLMNA